MSTDESMFRSLPPQLPELEPFAPAGYSVYVEITDPQGVSYHAGVELPEDARLGDVSTALIRSVRATATACDSMLAVMVEDRLATTPPSRHRT